MDLMADSTKTSMWYEDQTDYNKYCFFSVHTGSQLLGKKYVTTVRPAAKEKKIGEIYTGYLLMVDYKQFHFLFLYFSSFSIINRHSPLIIRKKEY